jgi:hypothetical protein
MKRLFTISAVITTTHFLEDVGLILIGRYTELNIFILMSGVLLSGFFLGSLSRIPKIKKFLGE